MDNLKVHNSLKTENADNVSSYTTQMAMQAGDTEITPTLTAKAQTRLANIQCHTLNNTGR